MEYVIILFAVIGVIGLLLLQLVVEFLRKIYRQLRKDAQTREFDITVCKAVLARLERESKKI